MKQTHTRTLKMAQQESNAICGIKIMILEIPTTLYGYSSIGFEPTLSDMLMETQFISMCGNIKAKSPHGEDFICFLSDFLLYFLLCPAFFPSQTINFALRL